MRVIFNLFFVFLFNVVILFFAQNVFASSFQLWEQDGASIGNYHAGYAALANDASTAFYNPAGISRIPDQQAVLGMVAVMSDFKYRGTVAVNGLGGVPSPVVAQGGTFNLIPDLHYVAPISDSAGFGFSVVVPFGLKTDYGRSTMLRYAGTLSSITIVDITPSLGFQLTDKTSVGLGFDIQKASAEFDNIGTIFDPLNDTESTNKLSDTGYGYHLGGLYQLNPNTRVGLSYHSQVVHHLTGSSKFIGPLNILTNGPLSSSRANARLTLPPYTAFSAYHRVCPQIAFMGSVIYTQWQIFKNLILNDYAGLVPGGFIGVSPSTNIQITVPEHYRNSWNFSLGADYYATEDITLRGAVGYDQTPVRNAYRNIQLPDNNRYVIAFGGHYQATKALGIDLGWTHLFIQETTVAPPPQVMGAQIVTTNGRVKGMADVLGGQVTWNFA